MEGCLWGRWGCWLCRTQTFLRAMGWLGGGCAGGELRFSSALLPCVALRSSQTPGEEGAGLPLPQSPGGGQAGAGFGRGLLGAQSHCSAGAVINCALVSLLLLPWGKETSACLCSMVQGTATPFCHWPHCPFPPCRHASSPPWGCIAPRLSPSTPEWLAGSCPGAAWRHRVFPRAGDGSGHYEGLS